MCGAWEGECALGAGRRVISPPLKYAGLGVQDGLGGKSTLLMGGGSRAKARRGARGGSEEGLHPEEWLAHGVSIRKGD